ncbi:MAG: hypothetical protein B6D63_07245 [Candidatus Latescibacteria bacterium 4484_7]|nr:MAG: hypothetical protein B6D63_07245 [Candidatus Latescibacteria bacterium 4484_7]
MKTHEMLGCELCGFRTKTFDGCYKFGITFKELDEGIKVHFTDDTYRSAVQAGRPLHNDFSLDGTNPCPFSPRRGILRHRKG